jgi:hypothetical protein
MILLMRVFTDLKVDKSILKPLSVPEEDTKSARDIMVN